MVEKEFEGAERERERGGGGTGRTKREREGLEERAVYSSFASRKRRVEVEEKGV